MPNVPVVDAPTQSQSGAPLNISPPAGAFGANVLGEGLQQLGATSAAISDNLAKHAEQFQALNNKAEADEAFVRHLQAANTYATKYQQNNLGRAAVDNLPQAMKDLDTQRDTIGQNMSNPMAKAMFDADSRRATANITGELSRFAVTQQKQYNLKQSVAVQEALASDTVLHRENFGANMAKMAEQQVFINAQLGLPPAEGELEMRKLFGNTVAMVSKTLAGNGDIEGASAFLEAHKEGMDGKIYADTVYQLKPAMMANDAASLAHEAVQDSLHGLGSSIGPTVDYLSNVHAREGNGKNPHSTADGTGQFIEKTWLSTMKSDPQFADNIKGKTDAEILALRHDPGVANRAIISYGQSNANYLGSKGLPANAATVGLAHGYGPGGAENLLRADPNAKVESVIGEQTAKNNRVLGQTVGQVIGGFTARFSDGSVNSASGGPPTSVELRGRMQSVLSLVDQKVQAKYGDNDTMRTQAEGKAMTELNRQIGAAENTETEAFTTLASVAMNQQIQDMPSLLSAVPGGLQMYNALPISKRKGLESAVYRNQTEVTPERLQNITMLNGMWGARLQNPEAFLNAPIAEMNLPLKDHINFLKMQSELRGKPAAADPQAAMLTKITATPEYKSLIGPDALNIKTGTEEEYTLRGLIAGQLEDWKTAHPTQPPDTKDIQAMIARAAGQRSVHWEVFGMKVGGSFNDQALPNISDDDKAGISRQLTKLGIPVTPFTIAKFYGQHADKGTK